jgi:hypothetical protein
MRSQTVPSPSFLAVVALLGTVLLPFAALGFEGPGVAVGHGGGVSVAAGHGAFGVSAGHGNGGGVGVSAGHGNGGGVAIGHGAGAHPEGGHGGLGISTGAHGRGGGHGNAAAEAGGEGSRGAAHTIAESDSPRASAADTEGPSAGDSAVATSGNGAADDSSQGQGGGPGADTGRGEKARGSYESRHAKFLEQRASLEIGMGPTRPDRGVQGALRWARMHPHGWSWGGATHAHTRSSTASPNFEPAFSSTVSSLPALPWVKVGHAGAAAGARMIDPPVPFHSAAAYTHPQRSLFRDTKKTVSSAPSAQPDIQREKPADGVIVGPAPDPVIAASQRWGESDSSTNSSQMRTSLIDEGRSETASAFAPQTWSMIEPFSKSPTQPLPKRGPILLIVLLSALSAYVFVRWTSVKCPQCGKLLEPGSVACRRCHSRSRSIRV